MSDAIAGLVGAVIGASAAFAGSWQQMRSQEKQAKEERRRTDADKANHFTGMVRLVGAELNTAKHEITAMRKTQSFEDENLRTTVWDAFKVELSGRLPFDVATDLLTAYAAIEWLNHKLSEEVRQTIAELQRTETQEAMSKLKELQNSLDEQRGTVLAPISSAFTALKPWLSEETNDHQAGAGRFER
jgi:hypothetical protein